MRVLVADDDDAVLMALELLLRRERIAFTCARSPREVLLAMGSEGAFDAVLLDLNYERDTTSGKEGFSLLDALSRDHSKVPVVVMTGWASIEGAVEAMRRGAVDYVPKPWDNKRLVALLRSLGRDERTPAREASPSVSAAPHGFASAAMKQVLATIEQVAFSEVPILVTGEHGTGKEIVARLIHEKSGRRGAFIAVNAGALPEGTFESELFGLVRGAFTDAKSDRVGAFARARDGTLFLDEIANMPLAQQAKLLRVLQDRAFQPLGAAAPEASTARIVSATNADVDTFAADGRFRADLMYRLNVIHLRLPPLRERRDEIATLAERFVTREAARYGLPLPSFDDEVMPLLASHDWPGNVRELEHAMQRAVLLSANEGRIRAAHLGLRAPSPPEGASPRSADHPPGTLREAERNAVLRALERFPEDRIAAAKSLGLSRSAFYRRLAQLGIPARAMSLRGRVAGAQVYLTVSVAVAAAFALGAVATRWGLVPALACGAAAIAACALVTARIMRHLARPLQTAANVLDAMRNGDYTHRARLDVMSGPAFELLREVNELALHLDDERGRAKEAAALLQAVVQRVDVALLAFDDEEVLRWWNPAAERLFAGKLANGVTAAQLEVEGWLEGPAERAVTMPEAAQATSPAWELRRGVFRREGHRYQFVLLTSLRRVRREEERAAWQRLLRVIGHEVNNTLAPIQSMAATCHEMLRDDPAAGEAVLPALEVIEHRAASLGRFIGEYARLARLPAPKPAPMKLGEHLRRLAAMDTRCPVEVIAEREVTVFADAPLLEQALVNLIRNAVDAAVVNQGKVTIDFNVEGDEAVVVIVDDGPGVENPDNLFVPLFSTKPGGSGIGLVLARNILEAHGGDVRLKNRERGAGCIARITLPLANFVTDKGPSPAPAPPTLAG